LDFHEIYGTGILSYREELVKFGMVEVYEKYKKCWKKGKQDRQMMKIIQQRQNHWIANSSEFTAR